MRSCEAATRPRLLPLLQLIHHLCRKGERANVSCVAAWYLAGIAPEHHSVQLLQHRCMQDRSRMRQTEPRLVQPSDALTKSPPALPGSPACSLSSAIPSGQQYCSAGKQAAQVAGHAALRSLAGVPGQYAMSCNKSSSRAPQSATAHVNALQNSQLLQRSDHLPLIDVAAAVAIITPANWSQPHGCFVKHESEAAA